MTHSVPLGRIEESSEITINRLSKLTSIPLSSLQDAIRFGEDAGEGHTAGDDKLGVEHQLILATFYGFETGLLNPKAWPEWSDPLAEDGIDPTKRRDTPEKFKERYLREHGPPERDTREGLREGPSKPTEPSSIKGLASIYLSGGQTGEGVTNIGLLMSCGFASVDVSPYRITLTSAVLDIDCGKARAREKSIMGLDQPWLKVGGSHGEVRCSWNGGDLQRLSWLMDATGISLGVIRFEPGALAVIENLAHGDIITASLGTPLKSIEATENSRDDHSVPDNSLDNVALIDRKGATVTIAAEKLTVEQRRIMEHLRKRVLELDEDNFAIVARHQVEFLRRDGRG